MIVLYFEQLMAFQDRVSSQTECDTPGKMRDRVLSLGVVFIRELVVSVAKVGCYPGNSMTWSHRPTPSGNAPDLRRQIPMAEPSSEDLTVALVAVLQAQGIARSDSSGRLEFCQDNLKQGFGTIVLTVVELLRELLERQTIRYMESGTLEDAQAEALGQTFLQLAEQIQALKKQFKITDEQLNLDLGPLRELR